MQIRRITAIRNEIVEQWFIPASRSSSEQSCTQCADASPWVSLVEAAAATGCPPATLRRLSERGEIHAGVCGEGHLVICVASIRELCNMEK